MTPQDRGLPGGGMAPVEPRHRSEPPHGVTSQQALWSWAVAAAVVFVLGILFYRVNSTEQMKTAGTPVTTHASNTAPGPQTTGQGNTGH